MPPRYELIRTIATGDMAQVFEGSSHHEPRIRELSNMAWTQTIRTDTHFVVVGVLLLMSVGVS